MGKDRFATVVVVVDETDHEDHSQQALRLSRDLLNMRIFQSKPCYGIAILCIGLVSLADALSSLSSKPHSPKIAAAVLVPGFLTGADDFQGLCDELTKYGIPTVAVPMKNWEWLPCVGGRSARPMLERIDFTVQHLVANGGKIDQIPNYQYSIVDAWNDFFENPGGVSEVGGSAKVEDYPVVEPCGRFDLPSEDQLDGQIALIGHSAGGWISRVYLNDNAYGGKSYGGSKYVHSLVTLGTPNAVAPGPAFSGVQWVETQESKTGGGVTVPALVVAGTGFQGDQWGGLTLGSYGFCSPDGSSGADYDGDGITPTFSALALQGATHLELPKVNHFCWSDVFGGEWAAPELSADFKAGGQWYGSQAVVPQWAGWILDQCQRT